LKELTMDLILWRHAEAQEISAGLADMDRELTPRGHKQASRVAAWLDRQLPDGTRVICSPARRTELAPGGSPAELLQLAQWPDAKGAVLVIGHQPTLGQAVAQLLGLSEPETALRKGAVWWLRTRERDGQRQTVIVAVQAPDTV
jgi:phosphohistidine phosphatase